jgi:glycerol kinase
MKKYLLAIDQGTTSSRALVYNEAFEVVGVGQRPFPQHFPKADWVEHKLEEIWASVQESIREALAAVKDPEFDASKISAIGITNQRETFGVWDRRSGAPVYNAIVWQCRRSASICEKFKKTAAGRALAVDSGLALDPYFSGTKLKWLLDQNKTLRSRARKGELAFGTIDTFLIWKLTHGAVHATDTTNASRTLMMDLKKCRWNPKALKTLGVPAQILPDIRASDAHFGSTQGLGFLPDGIAIHGVLGDQQAALFGQECLNDGEAKITYGTGAFLLLNTGAKPRKTKQGLSTIAWTLQGKTSYALEGSVFIAGAAVQWLRDQLKMIEKSSDIEGLAREVSDSDGVFFIPALSGLGSPYWAPQAKGLIGGLSRRSNRAHIARACLEGIAFSVADICEALVKDAGLRLKALRVDGGASANGVLLEIQSNALRCRVLRPRDLESTSRGAAYAAALGCGWVKSARELRGKNPIELEVKPQMGAKESKQAMELWRRRIRGLLAGAY